MDGYVTRRLWLDRDPQALKDWQALMQADKLKGSIIQSAFMMGHAWQQLGP